MSIAQTFGWWFALWFIGFLLYGHEIMRLKRSGVEEPQARREGGNLPGGFMTLVTCLLIAVKLILFT